MERGNRSYENMKMRLETGKPLNLNDQLNAISMGLIPTPRDFDCTSAMPKKISETGKTIKSSAGKSGGISLNAYAKLFPTPTMQDYKHRGPNSIQQGLANAARYPTPQERDWKNGSKENSGRVKKRNEQGFSPNFNDFVLWSTPRNNTGPSTDKKHISLDGAVKFWGTPTANDAKNTLSKSQRGRNTLTAHIIEAGDVEKGGQLNPDWVEALMGYPLGWTDIRKGEITKINYFEAWTNGTWENGLPRITLGMKNRVRRLKCLGNAVVPEIPAFLIELIVRVLWQ
jgi:hypothetical protein